MDAKTSKSAPKQSLPQAKKHLCRSGLGLRTKTKHVSSKINKSDLLQLKSDNLKPKNSMLVMETQEIKQLRPASQKINETQQ